MGEFRSIRKRKILRKKLQDQDQQIDKVRKNSVLWCCIRFAYHIIFLFLIWPYLFIFEDMRSSRSKKVNLNRKSIEKRCLAIDLCLPEKRLK